PCVFKAFASRYGDSLAGGRRAAPPLRQVQACPIVLIRNHHAVFRSSASKSARRPLRLCRSCLVSVPRAEPRAARFAVAAAQPGGGEAGSSPARARSGPEGASLRRSGRARRTDRFASQARNEER